MGGKWPPSQTGPAHSCVRGERYRDFRVLIAAVHMIYRELTIVLVTGLLQMFDIFLGHPRTADEEYHAILALLAEKKISSSLDARGASLRNALFFALRSGLDSDKVLKDLVKLLIQSTGREYNNVTKNVP